MELEHLFDGETWYDDDGLWVYGEMEAVGYASGAGTLSGPALTGAFRFSNLPRRREDGTWLPDIRGYVTTDDGAGVLLEARGISVPETGPGQARDVVCALTFRTSDARYAWLDRVSAIMEARHDPQTSRMRLRAFACVNELPASAQVASEVPRDRARRTVAAEHARPDGVA